MNNHPNTQTSERVEVCCRWHNEKKTVFKNSEDATEHEKIEHSLEFRVRHKKLKHLEERNFEEKSDDYLKNLSSALEFLNMKGVLEQCLT